MRVTSCISVCGAVSAAPHVLLLLLLYMQALYQLMSGCWWVCHGSTSRRERLVCEAVGAGQGEAHALRNGTHQA